MQVEIKIDSSYVEPKILIMAAAMKEDINIIVDKLSKEAPQIISGSKNEKIEVIEQEDLIRVYANAGKYLLLRIKTSTQHALDCMKWKND